MEHFHNKFETSHGGGLATAHQIARARYYWLALFKDAYEHVKACHTCQAAVIHEKKHAMPLQPGIEVRLLSQWGLDFIGMINPPSYTQHKYILTAIDYCTIWSEVQALKLCTTDVVIKFLEENIIKRLRVRQWPCILIYEIF
ncbi:uncharacterized protein LOC131035848 [Cryptomeria japonica]|uniref:uncharacterized protein LOC131035848 n=1 Tax=Cryptomeria japonica TaxID=3369 RepID=UPI0027DA3532|nr:uncharacterized protein LOC131035848 [Cryptomeria japonica]